MQSSIFDSTANWVCSKQNFSMPEAASETDITRTLTSLHALAQSCAAAILVPDLFPDSGIELLYVPPAGSEGVRRSAATLAREDVPPAALRAIGKALHSQMVATGADVANYKFEDGGEAVAYFPPVRDIVMRACGVLLLNE